MKKTLKSIIGAMALLVLAQSVQAATSVANINKGNVELNASADLSQTWIPNNDFRLLIVGTSAEYFLIDHLSVGGAFALAHAGGVYSSTSWSIGPSATYYFYQQDKLALYTGANFLFTSTNRTSDYFQVEAQLGAKYFITPAVAAGPVVSYGHRFDNNEIYTTNTLALAFGFAIHL